MTEKGLLLRDDAARPQVYAPAQAQEKTQLQLIDNLINRAFGGSATNLVRSMTLAGRITPAQLAQNIQNADLTR